MRSTPWTDRGVWRYGPGPSGTGSGRHGPWSAYRTPAAACTRNTCHTSSSPSSRPRRSGGASDLAWPSASPSSSSTAERYGPRAPASGEVPPWSSSYPWNHEPESAALRRMLAPVSTPDFVGESAAIRAVLELAQKAAASDSKVVILGESGTGKGVVARRIHDQSRRRQKAFLDVHCGAMAHELLDSELFGHERGAFTGAVIEKPGLFELADGGTLVLDDFAEVSPEMQSKLLKVLDHGELRRVGGVRTITVDVRVIVATNRDFDQLVRAGRLREDLLHGVDDIRITLPPLRERPEDIPRFVTHVVTLQQRRGLG